MRKPIILLLAAQCAIVVCQPYATASSDITLPNEIENNVSSQGYDDAPEMLAIRDLGDDEKARIVARATTATTTDSTTSTTSTTESTTSTTSTSETTTSSTTSTTTSDSTTTSSTTSTSTSSTSTSTTSTSTTSSSTTTSTSSTTTSTATSTSTTSAEIKEWNRKGNIAAIAFSCCLISLFLGISIIHCARDRAKSKRIAARELLKASAVSAEPLSHSKTNSTANLLPDRSSVMLKENPFSDARPQTARSTTPTPNNTSQGNGGSVESRQNATAPTADEHRESLV